MHKVTVLAQISFCGRKVLYTLLTSSHSIVNCVPVQSWNNSVLELKVTNNGLILYTVNGSYPLPLEMEALPGAQAGLSTSTSILIHFKLDVVIRVGFLALSVCINKYNVYIKM